MGSKVEPALKNLNLKVKAGESIALVGPSGAGKSTLINMLCRFQDPSTGGIFIDGIDINKYCFEGSERIHREMVPQKPFLFDVTVEENIEQENQNIPNQR